MAPRDTQHALGAHAPEQATSGRRTPQAVPPKKAWRFRLWYTDRGKCRVGDSDCAPILLTSKLSGARRQA